MQNEREYVLGTQDDELDRLGLQHAVWRARTLESWRWAGFKPGHRVLDVGCGPGYATFDLADIVGRTGTVVGLDQSARFLAAARARATARELGNVEFLELDLDTATIPAHDMDGAWGRWIFAFVRRPRELLARIHDALRPGGRLAVLEYFHYETWQVAPRSDAFGAYIAAVMRNWRAAGGEPDVGAQLPGWMEEVGFEVERLEPVVEAVRPTDFLWAWPRAFLGTSLPRLVDSGFLSADEARAAREAFENSSLVFTPAVIRIVARKPGGG